MVDVIIGYKALSAVVGLPAGKLKTMRHFGSLPLSELPKHGCQVVFDRDEVLSWKDNLDRVAETRFDPYYIFTQPPYKGLTLLDLLRHNVTPVGDCLMWNGGRMPNGYAVLHHKRKRHLVHRVVMEVINGENPDGLYVLHSCDNPGCCNPKHLSIGTPKDNVADMVKRKRNRTGAQCSWASLTDEDVIAIRANPNRKGRPLTLIATEYGVSQTTISKVLRGETYKNVPKP